MAVIIKPTPLRVNAAIAVANEESGKDFIEKLLYIDFIEKHKDTVFPIPIPNDFITVEEFINKAHKRTVWHFIGLLFSYADPNPTYVLKELKDYKRLFRVYNFLMLRKINTGK